MKCAVDSLDDNVGERAPDVGPDARPVGAAMLAREYRRHVNNSIG